MQQVIIGSLCLDTLIWVKGINSHRHLHPGYHTHKIDSALPYSSIQLLIQQSFSVSQQITHKLQYECISANNMSLFYKKTQLLTHDIFMFHTHHWLQCPNPKSWGVYSSSCLLSFHSGAPVFCLFVCLFFLVDKPKDLKKTLQNENIFLLLSVSLTLIFLRAPLLQSCIGSSDAFPKNISKMPF